MANNEKVQLMVKVARLYYEEGHSQNEIGEKLGLSRPYVSKLINEARNHGVVEIKIIDPYSTELDIESKVKEAFGLKKVIIVTTNNKDDIMDRIAIVTSQYLNSITKDDDIIGVGWGKTLYRCSKKIKNENKVNNVSVVQLCGAISMIEKNIYATEIPGNMAKALEGTPFALPMPAVVDSIMVRNAIENDRNVAKIIQMGKKANIAIFTMGLFGSESALARAGYLNETQVEDLLEDGVVGDVCSRLIDIDGNIANYELDSRTIGIELSDLRKKEYSIGVASGVEKVRCIYGALMKQYANVLITDEDVAIELLKLKEGDNR